jgi:hypothetical protein
MASGSELKVFESDPSNQGSNDWSSFSNFPNVPEDRIALKFSYNQLQFVVKNLEWTLIDPSQGYLV